jgi:hypothetical protein
VRNIVKKILKEEFDDWGWVEGPVNPWLEYDAIEFDVVPKKEDVQHYIELFLSIKDEFNNRDAWAGDNTSTINTIIDSVESGKPNILGFEDNFFSYGVKRYWEKDLKTIKYSDLIGSSLTESDDMDWIRDVSDNPLKFVEPNVTLDNVGRDEDGYPVTDGSGEGEIWVDVSNNTIEEKKLILKNIKSLLGDLIYDNPNHYCLRKDIKGFLIHCGHEDYNFFSQENHICCMGNDYEDEAKDGVYRPYIDGNSFL